MKDYFSPDLEITELLPEGVLCASGGTEDYDFTEFGW